MAGIDLHVHSAESGDGDVEPARLVAMARDAGVRVLAIADHNTTRAVGPALEAGRELGVTVVPAIEMDCQFGPLVLHLLGYGIRHGDPRYAELARSTDAQFRAASRRQIELVAERGIRVDAGAVMAKAKNGIVTGEMIAETALADPANAGNPLLAPYSSGGARSDNPFVNFYWDCCSPGKFAYVPIHFQSLAEAVSLIENTGGAPVLAHPGVNLGDDRAALSGLAAAGVRGVEAFSSYHSAEESLGWLGSAAALGLFATCGSDFHGKYKPPIKLGAHGGDDFETTIWRDLSDTLSGRFDTN